MSFRPSISVIVPTYNRVDTLVEVLDAIFAQTYPANEIIVADDGSSDYTVAVLRGRSSEKLKVLELEHSGLPAVARNAALQSAQGDWIAFCDSDDVWEPNKLARQVESRMEGSRALCTNGWQVVPNGDHRLMFKDLPQELTCAKLLRANLIINSSVLIERRLLMEVGGIASAPYLRGVEDYATWLRVSYLSSFQSINEPLVTYTDNSSHSVRARTGTQGGLTAPIAWLDFMGWMRQQGHPLTLSENAINVTVPRTIAANLRLIKKT